MQSGWVVSVGEHGAGRGRWRGQGDASPCRLLSTLCSQGCLLCGPQALGLWRVEYHLLIYHGWWWGGLETQEHSQRSSKRKKKNQNNQTHTYTREQRESRAGVVGGGGEEEHPVTQPERNTPGFTSGLLGKCPRKKKRLIDLSRLLVLSFKKFKLSVHMPIASAVFHYGCSLGQRSSFLISWFISNVPCDSSFFPPPSYASLISVKFLIGIKEKEEQWHNGKR